MLETQRRDGAGHGASLSTGGWRGVRAELAPDVEKGSHGGGLSLAGDLGAELVQAAQASMRVQLLRGLQGIGGGRARLVKASLTELRSGLGDLVQEAIATVLRIDLGKGVGLLPRAAL